jgi:hypothetical protein
MTRKTALKILILVIIIALGIVSYFVFFQNNNEQDGDGFNLPDQPVSNFFPDSEEFNPENQDNNGGENNNLDEFNIPKLRQISQNPVAGYVLIDELSTTTNTIGTTTEDLLELKTIYRYVNKSNGNILETTSRTTNTSRITNKTIPQVYESYFSEDGQNVIFRYLNNKNIETTLGVLSQDNSTSTDVMGDEGNFLELETSSLSRNIIDLDVLGDNVFYYLIDDFGINGFSFNFNNQNQQDFVFNSKMTQLDPQWLNSNTILFGTKPSNYSGGFLFSYDINSGSFEKVLNGDFGFNFLPKPNYNLVAYSQTEGSVMNSYVINLETGQEVNMRTNTIVSDKCVWSKNEENIIYCAEPRITIGLGYPNVWYQGQISLIDDLYKIDVQQGTKSIINMDGQFDITNIDISDNGEYITFVNKRDLTLWSLDIN